MNSNDITIHPDFRHYASFINTIPSDFENIGVVLNDGRNIVKMVTIDNQKFVIKYFKKVTLFNRLIYRFFRKSKAQRSYENALTLLDLNILTPFPVASVNCNKGMLLARSYFISLYVDHTPLQKIIENPLIEIEHTLKDFGRFTYLLHKKGVFHNDFHLNNILCKTVGNEVNFYLIDNNRMSFRRHSHGYAMRNMKRIALPLDKKAVFIKEYANQSNMDAFDTFRSTLHFREVHQLRQNLKRTFKSILQFKLSYQTRSDPS